VFFGGHARVVTVVANREGAQPFRRHCVEGRDLFGIEWAPALLLRFVGAVWCVGGCGPCTSDVQGSSASSVIPPLSSSLRCSAASRDRDLPTANGTEEGLASRRERGLSHDGNSGGRAQTQSMRALRRRPDMCATTPPHLLRVLPLLFAVLVSTTADAQSTSPSCSDASSADARCASAIQPASSHGVHQLTDVERRRIVTLQNAVVQDRDNAEKRQAAALEIAALRSGTMTRLTHAEHEVVDQVWREVSDPDVTVRRNAVRRLSAVLGAHGFHAGPQQVAPPSPLIASPLPMNTPGVPYPGLAGSARGPSTPPSPTLPYPTTPSPPPTLVSPPAAPPVITTCDVGGCWDSSGRRYTGNGPMLVSPSGRPCQRVGAMLQCP